MLHVTTLGTESNKVNHDISIPTEYQDLIASLRGAVTGAPPDSALASADWPRLFVQAREQGVDTYLYPWLAANLPDLFLARGAPPDSAPAAWRARFLAEMPLASLRRRQLCEILSAFAQSHIEVIVLKGAWLSETVYGDPAQRTMSDLDLLIRIDQCDAAHAALLSLGYTARTQTLHSRFAYDQTYAHPAHRLPVELHWDVTSEQEDDSPAIDMATVWQQTAPALFCGQTIRALPPEDQLAHLVHHMLHHQFAAPLRCYLDIALLVWQHSNALAPAALEAAGQRWRTGRALPFVLRFTGDILACGLPAPLLRFAAPLDAQRRNQALHAVFHLPTAHARSAETTLLRFTRASPAGRLRLALSRIFMPRPFLAAHYPCARHLWSLPWAWICRLRDLRLQHGKKLRTCFSRDPAETGRIATAAQRDELTRWLRG